MTETQPEWAKRIERKLDAIIEALTAEDEDGEGDDRGQLPEMDMAGRVIKHN